MKDIALASYSNENVSLINFQDQLCVLKTSVGDIQRFHQNIFKQKMFQPLAISSLTISAASILQYIEEVNHVGIVMPYVNGLTGEEFAIHGNREIARELSRSLSALLMNSFSCSRIQSVKSQSFIDKMEQILDSNYDARFKPNLMKAYSWLLARLKEKTLAIPLGDCHGDLTLSNIIFSHSKGLVLIDFLACFIESPLQDLAKIIQEFSFGWSFRRLEPNLQTKAHIFCHYAYPDYANYFSSLFPNQSAIFNMLCLARIAPYVSDELTLSWLNKALNSFLATHPLNSSQGVNR